MNRNIPKKIKYSSPVYKHEDRVSEGNKIDNNIENNIYSVNIKSGMFEDEKKQKDNVVKEKSFRFAVRVINLYKFIIQKKKEYILSRQILRSGTAIGANIEEALGGVSKKDFTNKLSIAYKEARETEYWLKLLKETKYITLKMYDSMFFDCNEISKLLFVIIRKTKSY